MKGFIIGLVLSTTIMFAVVYTTVVNPSLLTSVFTTTDDIETTEETVMNEEELPSTNASYLERIEKGDTLMEGGYHSLAVIEYQFAVDLEPELSEPLYKLAEAYYADEDYRNAHDAALKSTELNPNNLDAQYLLGLATIELGQFEAAKTHFATVDSQEVHFLYYRGVLSAYFGEYDGAESYFNQTIESGESSELSENSQNYLSSMSEWQLAEDADPNYAKTLIGRSLAETHESTLATALLYDILSENPNYRDAWIILGYSYLTVEKYTDARDALIKALELDSTKAETRYFLGIAYFGLDEYPSSVPQFELAIESGFEPRVQAYQKLADAAVLSQEYEKAAEAYENVLVLNSSDVDLYIRPVWLYVDHLNNPQRALELGKEAVTNHPNEAMSYNLLGWAQIATNDLEGAEQNLSYALVLDPDLAAAYLNYGRLYEVRGDNESAKENYKRAYTLDPGGSIGNLAAERYNALVESISDPENTP